MKIELRSQYPSKQIGLPGGDLELSWKVFEAKHGESQLAYEIQSALDVDFEIQLTSDQAKSSHSQYIKAPHTPNASREISFHRVRIETESGWSEWSNTLTHETGLLNGEELIGHAIGDESKSTDPAALLRTTFSITKPVKKARLYATAHGTYDVMINGAKAGDHILAPGWTPYQLRLLVDTHDVTNHLVEGENAFGVLLTDGWYRGKMSFFNMFDNYGEHNSFLGQIEIDYEDGTSEIIATDSNWKTATGGVRFASIYDGTTMDFTMSQPAWCKPGFDDSTWTSVTLRNINKSILEPLSAPPVRVKAELPMTIRQESDRVNLDGTQNISGWVRLTVEGKRGDKVVVRHAEILLPNKTLHTEPLRDAKATDTYILGKDGVQDLEPKHTFHGFQFADVVSEAKVVKAVAIAITSDNEDRGLFQSSHKLLNKLHSNVLWSLRDNYVSIPTDCPQRDERLGWTGDAQAFIYAANTLVNENAFFRSWMKDLALEQHESGKVPHVIPDILEMQHKRLPNGNPFPDDGAAGWGDAAVVIPWAQYQSFGDLEILRNQLHSMRAWVDFFSSWCEDGVFRDGMMQLGDWLDPDAPEDKPFLSKVSSRFVASAYISHSARLLSKTEVLVGTKENAAKYEDLANTVAKATWTLLGDAARKTTTGCSLALEFRICPDDQREAVAAGLAELVRRDKGAISTGFLGTPVIMDAMSQNGHFEEAYSMLLREEIRSWLYPITVGATTIWERWEAIKPDGSISDGGPEGGAEGTVPGMISFNHYAYGAVIDWVYRNVLGLTSLAPGYEQVSVSPRPTKSIDWAKGSIETGYGEYGIDWKLDGSKLHAKVSVPFGVQAKLNLPVTEASTILVNGEAKLNGDVLGHGIYDLDVTHAHVASK
ncbi:MAG: family 78 glycoside hydrolase catalytic domain [Micrococcales bacterium]